MSARFHGEKEQLTEPQAQRVSLTLNTLSDSTW